MTISVEQLISCLDLTSLNADDNIERIETLCQAAQTTHGPVAAVCVYPQFVATAQQQLANTSIHIATVTNFPSGEQALDKALEETQQAIDNGADEIDVVMPYRAYLQGKDDQVTQYLQQVKQVCGEQAHLKVILETGVLADKKYIAGAAELAIHSGANFIKTSTGKVSPGATIQAVRVMLDTIKQINPAVGCKVAGGVRQVADAMNYAKLAAEIMGEDYVQARTFRLGASSLLNALLMSQGRP